MQDYYENGYNLEEFRFSPVGLTPYTVFKNPDFPPVEIYSSKLIEENVIKRVEASETLKPIKDLVITGLKNRKIIIGYTNPSKFSFLYRRVKKLFGYIQTWSLGLYDYNDDIIYIILDDNVNILGNAVLDLSNILIHELCHMAANHNKRTKIFDASLQPLLIPFYFNLLGLVLVRYKGLKPKEFTKQINLKANAFIKELEPYFNKIETQKKSNLKAIENRSFEFWADLIPNLFPQLDELDGTETAMELFLSYDRLFNGSKDNIDKEILDSYRKIGIMIKFPNMFGQEIVFPSEIIAISNENGLSPSIASCINKINMGK